MHHFKEQEKFGLAKKKSFLAKKKKRVYFTPNTLSLSLAKYIKHFLLLYLSKELDCQAQSCTSRGDPGLQFSLTSLSNPGSSFLAHKVSLT